MQFAMARPIPIQGMGLVGHEVGPLKCSVAIIAHIVLHEGRAGTRVTYALDIRNRMGLRLF